MDIALFSAGSAVSKRYAEAAVAAGAVVIDNSSAFRMRPDVPLVVPEVNAAALAGHRGIIANPNCVAAIATVVLAPLHRAHPIRRLQAATYQAASGAGAAAMAELRTSTEAYLRDEPFTPRVFPHPPRSGSARLWSRRDSGWRGCRTGRGRRLSPWRSRCVRKARVGEAAEAAARGERVVVTKHGRPFVELAAADTPA